MLFADRRDAARKLAQFLGMNDRTDPPTVVLGLPSGGVVVAVELARLIFAEVDVYLARKVGVPGNPELAMAAVASDGTVVINHAVVDHLGIGPERLARRVEEVKARLLEEMALYHPHGQHLAVGGRRVVLVDDGAATGATAASALTALRQHRPSRLILALPVAPRDTIERLRGLCDELFCVHVPEQFEAVGAFYEHWEQITHAATASTLRAAHQPGPKGPG